jgi:ankyrin repeat protein
VFCACLYVRAWVALLLQAGHLEVAKWLVRGQKVDALQYSPNALGETPLSWACRRGHVQVARFLAAAVRHERSRGLRREWLLTLQRRNVDGWSPCRLATAFGGPEVCVYSVWWSWGG